jgi:hypothetical protein
MKQRANRIAVFDTSSIKAISSSALAGLAAAGYHLWASPFAVWETLSHLDEPGRFELSRANLLKLRHFDLFDDAVRTVEASLGTLTLPAFHPDPVVLRALLQRLEESFSVAGVYADLLVMDDGTHRFVHDCAARARHVLVEEENKFRALLHQVGEHVRTTYDRRPNSLRRIEMVVSLVQGGVLRADAAGRKKVTIEEAVDLTFLFWGYVTEQAIRYRGRLADIPANDFEDSQLLLHLPLSRPAIVVTEDRRQRETVNAIVELTRLLDDVPAVAISATAWRDLSMSCN